MSERDVVLDASAVVVALTSTSPDAVSLRRQLVGSTTHAPHLLDAEVGSALRGRSLEGHLPDGVVPELLDDAAALVEHRYPHHGALALAAWRLRHNATFHDALYVALAASLDATLVTADARLATAPGCRAGCRCSTSERTADGARPGRGGPVPFGRSTNVSGQDS